MSPSRPTRIALFPLQTVLFPDGLLPLQIFETRYVDLVRDCLRTESGFGVVPIRQGQEAGHAAIPFEIGTYGTIVDWSRGENGLLNILVQGRDRFRITSQHAAPHQLITAEVEWLTPPASIVAPEKYKELKAFLQRIHEETTATGETLSTDTLMTVQIAYRIAALLPLPIAEKVALLGLNDDAQLLSAIESILGALLAVRATRH